MLNKRGISSISIVIFIIILLSAIGIYFLSSNGTDSDSVGCTMEARICPDGSSVGRLPELDCEFEKCPEVECIPNYGLKIGYSDDCSDGTKCFFNKCISTSCYNSSSSSWLDGGFYLDDFCFTEETLYSEGGYIDCSLDSSICLDISSETNIKGHYKCLAHNIPLANYSSEEDRIIVPYCVECSTDWDCLERHYCSDYFFCEPFS